MWWDRRALSSPSPRAPLSLRPQQRTVPSLLLVTKGRKTGKKHLFPLFYGEAGKGYFIAKTDVQQPLKVFLLFNKLSAHKKILYDAFAARLGEDAAIDFYIYNNDFTIFKKLLENKAEGYTHHVIIPHFLEGGEKAHELINQHASENLLLLDKLIPGIQSEHSAVYEDFSNDIHNALEQALDQPDERQRRGQP